MPISVNSGSSSNKFSKKKFFFRKFFFWHNPRGGPSQTKNSKFSKNWLFFEINGQNFKKNGQNPKKNNFFNQKTTVSGELIHQIGPNIWIHPKFRHFDVISHFFENFRSFDGFFEKKAKMAKKTKKLPIFWKIGVFSFQLNLRIRFFTYILIFSKNTLFFKNS